MFSSVFMELLQKWILLVAVYYVISPSCCNKLETCWIGFASQHRHIIKKKSQVGSCTRRHSLCNIKGCYFYNRISYKKQYLQWVDGVAWVVSLTSTSSMVIIIITTSRFGQEWDYQPDTTSWMIQFLSSVGIVAIR